MLIHLFLALLILFLWGSAYFFYKKGNIFLQILNENKEKNYQSKVNYIIWFQIIASLLALICFILDQPKLDLMYLITLLLVSAGIGFSLIKN